QQVADLLEARSRRQIVYRIPAVQELSDFSVYEAGLRRVEDDVPQSFVQRFWHNRSPRTRQNCVSTRGRVAEALKASAVSAGLGHSRTMPECAACRSLDAAVVLRTCPVSDQRPVETYRLDTLVVSVTIPPSRAQSQRGP